MKHIGIFARLSMKWVLRSALTFETEIYHLYESLGDEFGNNRFPKGLAVIVDEEQLHQKFIKDLIAGRLSEQERTRILEKKSFHEPAEIEPLTGDQNESIIQKLTVLSQRERAIHSFYFSLYKKSKIPAIKNVYKFLADQEEGHGVLLDRLLSATPDVGSSPSINEKDKKDDIV